MMSAGGRTKGSKVVAIAVAGTLGALGIGTIYLPFIADRDQMRGMDEDGGMDAKSRRQMEQYLKNEALNSENANTYQAPQTNNRGSRGSMWSNMKK